MADLRDRDVVAEAAIARVLAAERDARASIAQAKADVPRIAEAARGAARSLSGRTERRIRCVVAAFERELALRLEDIDAQTRDLDVPQPIVDHDRAALQRAVAELARQLIGAPP
jgi:hypothetical protein